MSSGLVICSVCKREVHQDGPASTHTTITGAPYTLHGWQHCEDKTPRCDGASSIWPMDRFEIVGKFCGRDEMQRRES